MNFDIQLALLDFAEAYERDPENAVQALSGLLLDERACAVRIEFLRALHGLANADQPDRLPDQSDERFDDAIGLIHEVSRGLPRQVNNLAVSSLIAAFAAKKGIVDESSARAAVAEVSSE